MYGIYLKGYMLVMDAEKLEKQNNFAGAYYKYQEAGKIYDSIARNYPNFNPDMVSFRRRAIRQKLVETSQKERERRQAAATTAGLNAGATGDLLPPIDGGAPFSDSPPPPAVVRPAASTSTGNVVDAQLNQMQTRIASYDRETEALKRTLEQKEEELLQVKQRLLESTRQANEALRQQLDLQSKLDTADARRARETGELKKQLEETTAALERANALQQEANAKVEGLLTELTSARETIAQLTKEKNELAAERVQLLALIQSKDGTGAADALLAENKRLRQQLEDAEARVASLQHDKEAAAKEVAALREQITKMGDELAQMRKENEEYRNQIAGLSAKLEEARQQLLAAPSVIKDDSELARENAMLRQILVEQLRHQKYREDKKRLALEQLAKLQISNEELLSTIEEIAAPPAPLSEEETRRLQDPVITEFKENQGMSATLLAKADNPGAVEDDDRPIRSNFVVRGRQHLTPDQQVLAEAGLADLQRRQPAKARRAFQTILEEDPTNVFVLSNLAVAQMEQRDYAGAIKSLRKALAYKEDDAFCHYMLGVANYRQGRLEDAATSLVNSLDFNPNNSRAHFYLGCVFNKRGDLEQAREEFEKSVTAEPTFGDAHYNLAAIYASMGNAEKATHHYKQAIANGSSPDPQLEQMLGLNAQSQPAEDPSSAQL